MTTTNAMSPVESTAIKSHDRGILRSISPVDDTVVWEGLTDDQTTLNAAMERAVVAQREWAQVPAEKRWAIIERFANTVAEHADHLVDLIAKEIGKPRWDARQEVNAMVNKAGLSRQAYERVQHAYDEAPAVVVQRPLGVVVVLGPFNFPGHLANGQIIPSLAAGNAVMFKPSELAPAVGEKMVELWRRAGLPDDVLSIVHGGGEVGRWLVDDPRTSAVLFTGGIETGRAIHRALAGTPEVLLALELGGNNPVVAWSLDASDRERAADAIVRSAFTSSGQRCTCARRLLTNDRALVDAVVRQTAGLAVGSPFAEPEPFMGPLVTARAVAAVMEAIDDLVARGASVLVAPTTLGGAYMTPAILDCTNATDVPDVEIFGPVLQVTFVDELGAALELANTTQFGLASAIFTSDTAVAELATSVLHAGIVNCNVATVGASGAVPFGGLGASGNHRPAGAAVADYVSQTVVGLHLLRP